MAKESPQARLHSGLFDFYLKKLDAAVAVLHQQKTESVAKRIDMWESTWNNAYDRVFDVRREDLLTYGTLLGRIAETYSFHPVAEEVFDRLAESAINREHWISHPASVLITAGEFNRRRANLDLAEKRYQEAARILEDDLATTECRQRIHGDLGRLFYELAYLHRLRGNAGATRSTLERSEAECELAEDELGTQIARSVLAVVSYEEGLAGSSVTELKACLSRLEQLVDDPGVKRAGRDGLARRWVVNARTHLGQAYVAAGDNVSARRMIGRRHADEEKEPSVTGLATALRVEAQLYLAEGHPDLAQDAISASWNAIEQQGDLLSAELAAATVTIAGLTNALMGSRDSALSCFKQACGLPPDLHNRRAQGLAWAGRAILAREGGDHPTSLAAVREGLAVVQLCGAPVRAFLLELLRNSYSTGGPNLNDLKVVVCRSG